MNPVVATLHEKIRTVPIEFNDDIFTKSKVCEIVAGVRSSMVRATISEMGQIWRKKEPTISDGEIGKMHLPTLDGLVAGLEGFLWEVVSSAKANKPVMLFKKSDAADLFHAAYIPYVRIFRCDTAWVDKFRKVGAKYGTTIVGRVGELHSAILDVQKSRIAI